MTITTTSSATAPLTSLRDTSEVELLLAFVHGRDHPCPRCGYNLRNLTQPVCPECREDLMLKVGVVKIRLWGLLLTLAPGMFSAVAVGLFIVLCFVNGPPPTYMWQPYSVVGFLVVSGIFALAIALNARRFLWQSFEKQTAWIVAMWLIHGSALFIVMRYF